jgi:signal transduction histidine kinase
MSEIRFAEMISKIAHELRSPLTSVKGFSATLLSRWDRFNDQQRYELVEAIHSDAERMGRIVSEVLDLARIESGRLELHRDTVHISRLVDKAISAVAALPGSARIAIDVPEDLAVLGDPERLQHVFFNLVENAVKFSDDGPIFIAADSEGDMVIVRVSDSGVGIEADRLEEIFLGPGPTGQSATPKGTGLGLYLTKRLIEAHGGEIAVLSEPDVNTTFTVRLPALTI